MNTARTARIPLVAAGLLAASLALTGCLPNPVDVIVDRTLEENGVDVDNGEFSWESEDGAVKTGEDLDLPDSFPADVPTPDGRLVGIIDSGDSGLGTQWEDVTRDEVTGLTEELQAAGFEKVGESVTETSYFATFETEERVVSVIWDAAESSGGALTYGLSYMP